LCGVSSTSPLLCRCPLWERRSRRGITCRTSRTDRGRRSSGPTQRLLIVAPPLGSLTKVSLPIKAKPPQGPVNRGLAAAYFGANSVASALNLPRDLDVPRNHPHSKPHLSNRTSKPDISTWQRIGHFYLALTVCCYRSFGLLLAGQPRTKAGDD
jgi:hypothetical protein